MRINSCDFSNVVSCFKGSCIVSLTACQKKISAIATTVFEFLNTCYRLCCCCLSAKRFKSERKKDTSSNKAEAVSVLESKDEINGIASSIDQTAALPIDLKKQALESIAKQEEDEIANISTLDFDQVLRVLTRIKERQIPFNFQGKNSEGDTLLIQWTKKVIRTKLAAVRPAKNAFKIVALILDIDPTAIHQIRHHPNLLAKAALLTDGRKEAEAILRALESERVPLSNEENWIKRALQNDDSFPDEAFNALDVNLKQEIYYLANAFGSERLVAKLNSLGMTEEPRFSPGPAITATNMDIVTTGIVFRDFLRKLRIKGQLLTRREFDGLDRDKFIYKTKQIGRILGTDFIEKIIRKEGLKHIKVPRKIAVIDEGVTSITMSQRGLEPQSKELAVYAERIASLDRKLSLAEALEFMIVIEKTGYNDFAFGLRNNHFFAADGIYFIDTEFGNFSPRKPRFDAMKAIEGLLENPADVESFRREYEKRKAKFEREAAMRKREDETLEEYFEACYGCKYLSPTNEFAFPVTSVC